MEEQPIVQEPAAQQTEGGSVTQKPSHESFFGTLLFSFMMVLLIGTVSVIGWGVYRGIQLTKEQSVLPSIATLPGEERTEVKETPKAVASPTEPGSTAPLAAEESLKKAKATDIKVLNGGAAKGSATLVTELLKKAGYTKVTPGNTINNYTGIVVYYALGLDQEAGAVKETLVKTYPKAEIKPTVKGNSETSQASLTVILGK